MKINVVGIDPSLNNFGFSRGIIDINTLDIEITSVGIAKTESMSKQTAKKVRKNSDDIDRAQILYNALQQECQGATFAFVEVPVGSQSARAMASYGICVGVLASCPIPMIQLTPTEVKLAAVGSKTATKEEMIAWATTLYPNVNWMTRKVKGKLELLNGNEHLADATAAIHAGVLSDQFQQAIALMRRVA